MTNMNRLLQIVLSGVVLLALAALLGQHHGGASYAAPPASSVVVTNTSAQPVPIHLTDSSVPVSGTVNLAATTSVGIAGNSALTPFFVRDVDNPAAQPFSAKALFSWANGEFLANAFIVAVPPGKRLVIEFVSANVNMPPGQKPYHTVLYATDPTFGNLRSIHLNATLQGSSPGGGFDSYVANQPVRIYASPGEYLAVQVYRNSTASTFTDAIADDVAGYLVDLP